jgi:hypothetical protein
LQSKPILVHEVLPDLFVKGSTLKLVFEAPKEHPIQTNLLFNHNNITLEYNSETNSIIYSSIFDSSDDHLISPTMAPDYFFDQDEIIIQIPNFEMKNTYYWV